MNWMLHLFGIHRPKKGYSLQWAAGIGFYTECEICKCRIIRDYDGNWNLS